MISYMVRAHATGASDQGLIDAVKPFFRALVMREKVRGVGWGLKWAGKVRGARARSLTHSLTHSTQYPRRVAIAVWGYLTDGYALPEATMKELFHDYEGESTTCTVICMRAWVYG